MNGDPDALYANYCEVCEAEIPRGEKRCDSCWEEYDNQKENEAEDV